MEEATRGRHKSLMESIFPFLENRHRLGTVVESMQSQLIVAWNCF